MCRSALCWLSPKHCSLFRRQLRVGGEGFQPLVLWHPCLVWGSHSEITCVGFELLGCCCIWGFCGREVCFPITTLVLKMLTQRLTCSWLQHSFTVFLTSLPCSLSCKGTVQLWSVFRQKQKQSKGQNWWERPLEQQSPTFWHQELVLLWDCNARWSEMEPRRWC